MSVAIGIAASGLFSAGAFVWLQARASAAAGRAVGRATAIALGGASAWLALSLGLALSGVLANFEARPPPLMVLFAGMLIASIVLGLSRAGSRVAEGVGLPVLIGLQAFRVPLELVMHQAAADGLMPPQLTFTGEGLNFDVVSGALALPVAWALAAGRAGPHLAWAWTILSGATLTAVVGIAVLSTPVFHAFGTDPAHLNTWVAEPPYVWLGAGPVSFAVFTQVVLVRRLLTRADRRGTAPPPR